MNSSSAGGYGPTFIPQFTLASGPIGMDLEAYYFLNDHLGFGTSFNNYTFTGSYNPTVQDPDVNWAQTNVSFLSFTINAKYYLLDGIFRPYLLGAGGPTLYTVATPSTGTEAVVVTSNNMVTQKQQVFPLFEGGLGFKVNIIEGVGIFAQAKYNFVFTDTGTVSFLPVEAGINVAYSVASFL